MPRRVRPKDTILGGIIVSVVSGLILGLIEFRNSNINAERTGLIEQEIVRELSKIADLQVELDEQLIKLEDVDESKKWYQVLDSKEEKKIEQRIDTIKQKIDIAQANISSMRTEINVVQDENPSVASIALFAIIGLFSIGALVLFIGALGS